ncbi:MAG: hypothetical protein ABFS46_20735, partial [Myxococcota bacterium]
PLGEYLESLGTTLHNGYQVTGDRKDARHMWHLPDLRGHDLDFFIDTDLLEKFCLPHLHRPREAGIYRAPLLVVHESMVVDGLRPRSGLATEDLAYDERFDGIPFADVEDGGRVAAYVQLVLQSSLTTHLLLMLDGQFGVEREVVHLETLKALPIVPWHTLAISERKMAVRLSGRLRRGLDTALQEEIDVFAARLHGLCDVQRDAVFDTLSTSLTTKDARTRALRRTTATERNDLAETCQIGLQDVLSATELTAWVRTRDDLSRPEVPWHFIQVDCVPQGKGARRPVPLPLDPFVRAADAGAASLIILRTGKGTTLVGILDRFRHWTRTKARLLASTLLAEEEP